MNGALASRGGATPVRTARLTRTTRAVWRDLAALVLVVVATGASEVALHYAALHGTGARALVTAARTCPRC